MNDTRKQWIVVLALVASVALAATAHAQPASGLQQTPDSARYLISKDVGAERWAISFNLNDRTVTGNVFKTDGSAPSFIWCRITDVAESAVPADVKYTLDCSGADACTAAPCTPTQWTTIATGIVLPGSFLLPSQTKATFAGNVQPIFDASCAFGGCHGGSSPKAALNLEASVSYGEIFLQRLSPGAPYLVEPFAPDASSLLESMVRSGGGIMPPAGRLPDDQIDAIRNWILEGAAEN
jgi:hypothetical protein